MSSSGLSRGSSSLQTAEPTDGWMVGTSPTMTAWYGSRWCMPADELDGRAVVLLHGIGGAAAIDSRGLKRPVLVGHSMGGMIAQTMLRRRPDAYSAVVLACTSPAFGNADG